MNFKFLLLASVLPFLAACWSPDTSTVPYASLSRVQHVFVERELVDGQGVDKFFVRELQRLGYDASSGAPTMCPDNADVILSYEAEWEDDFTQYLIRLSVRVRDAHTDKPIAVGTFFRPSVTGHSVAYMVRGILAPIFKPKPARSSRS